MSTTVIRTETDARLFQRDGVEVENSDGLRWYFEGGMWKVGGAGLTTEVLLDQHAPLQVVADPDATTPVRVRNAVVSVLAAVERRDDAEMVRRSMTVEFEDAGWEVRRFAIVRTGPYLHRIDVGIKAPLDALTEDNPIIASAFRAAQSSASVDTLRVVMGR